MLLVNYSLVGGHTHTYTHPHESDFKKPPARGWFKSKLFHCVILYTIVTTTVKSRDEKDDILNLLKSQITDTAASRDKASKVLCYVHSMYTRKFSIF